MKWIIAILVTLVILMMIAFGIVVAVIMNSNTPTQSGQNVRLYTVQPAELIESISAPGEVAPKSKVDISARVAARITELPFKEGQTVTAGNPDTRPPIPPSLLVRLDSTDLEAALKAAEARKSAQIAQIKVETERLESQKARIVQSKSLLEKAEKDLQRQKQLFESKDVSQESVDALVIDVMSKKADLDSAEHSLAASMQNLAVLRHHLEAAEADVERARDQLTYTTITSPINGIVTKVNAEVGELAITGTMNNPGTVILQVADLSNMIVDVRVDEADIADVNVGQPAAVRIHAYPDKVFRGTVTQVALVVTAFGGEKYFETEILLDTEDEKVYSGLTADVDIETQKYTDIIAVPSQAVMSRNVDSLPVDIRDGNENVDMNKTSTPVVYRFIDGKAIVTPVTIGPSDATNTLIESGLAIDDQVIIGPYKILESLKHEQKVQDEKADKENKDTADEEKNGDDTKEKQPDEKDAVAEVLNTD